MLIVYLLCTTLVSNSEIQEEKGKLLSQMCEIVDIPIGSELLKGQFPGSKVDIKENS